MQKKTLKALVLTMAIAVVVVCGIMFGGCNSAESATLKGSYTYSTYGELVTTSTDWKIVYHHNIMLYSDGTYTYVYTEEWFGQLDSQHATGDMECKGRSVVIRTGTYTSAVSSEADYYLDLTLSKAERIVVNNSNKMFEYGPMTYGTSILYAGSIDTSDWDASETLRNNIISKCGDSASAYASLDAFLAAFGTGYTVTVTDPTLEPENAGLRYVMNTAPVAVK